MCLAAFWDLEKEGKVFGLAAGPYGTTFALVWDRDNKHGGYSRILMLHENPGKALTWLASYTLYTVAMGLFIFFGGPPGPNSLVQ